METENALSIFSINSGGRNGVLFEISFKEPFAELKESIAAALSEIGESFFVLDDCVIITDSPQAMATVEKIIDLFYQRIDSILSNLGT